MFRLARHSPTLFYIATTLVYRARYSLFGAQNIPKLAVVVSSRASEGFYNAHLCLFTGQKELEATQNGRIRQGQRNSNACWPRMNRIQ